MSSPARAGGAPEDQAEADVEEETGRGTWRHAAFHVATTIATPAAYAPLPFAVASLGWPLVQVSAAWLLGHWLHGAQAWLWPRYGGGTGRNTPTTGSWQRASLQVASVGNNIAIQIAAGSSLKAVYKHYHTADDGAMTLQQFILVFGALELLLSQLPDIHSLRWVNAICTASTVGFAGTTIGVTIYDGYRIERTGISYSLQGSTATKIFRAFNALGTIAFSFGDAMLPEIQSTVREPVRANMYKGVSSAYTIIVVSYWTLAFSGYWAFGSQVQPYILSSLTAPRWATVMANLFAVIQIAGCFQIYCRPTFAHFEERVQAKKNRSCRSCLCRLTYTSAYMAMITLVSAAMPFFGDFVSVCGAVGFTPLDFVLPALALLKTRTMPDNPGLQCAVKMISAAVAILFSIIGALACIGAIRSIALDVKTYKFFHDM
ncbi:GABA transporter 1 isoform X2 [Sorghum bicolor]|uniref:GABA transporter 1 isoform X2 n=1 Tax=Sorghum bicolor TaxID=4558 RepID=UPI000B426655|nr:GABA transporter 1 isoform X2 [Sorghum bicolor]|eukprot:XP_021304202.1 GABA transporter 1 isoform X2 [Sorghum bicolor]